jgi:hypothetical protein
LGPAHSHRDDQGGYGHVCDDGGRLVTDHAGRRAAQVVGGVGWIAHELDGGTGGDHAVHVAEAGGRLGACPGCIPTLCWGDQWG